MCGRDLGPNKQEGRGSIAVNIADLIRRENGFSPREGDVTEKAGDNWKMLESLTLWSVN